MVEDQSPGPNIHAPLKSTKYWGSFSTHFWGGRAPYWPGWIVFNDNELYCKSLIFGQKKAISYAEIKSGRFLIGVLWLCDIDGKTLIRLKSPHIRKVHADLTNHGIIVDEKGLSTSLAMYWFTRFIWIVLLVIVVVIVVASIKN